MLEVNEQNFEEEVTKSDKPIIVDFWASWCGPCKMLGPVFEKVSQDMPEVKFAKLNVDENKDLQQKNAVMGIPCMIIFKNGEEVDRIVGFQPEEKLKENIKNILA